MAWRIVPTVISALLLAAHFLRGERLALVALSLALPLLLIARRGWAVRVVQAALALAAGLWVLTAMVIAQQRLEADSPWARMALILGAVAAWTLGSAGLLQRVARAWRARPPLPPGEDGHE